MKTNSYRHVLAAFIKVTLDTTRTGPLSYAQIPEPGKNKGLANKGFQTPMSPRRDLLIRILEFSKLFSTKPIII